MQNPTDTSWLCSVNNPQILGDGVHIHSFYEYLLCAGNEGKEEYKTDPSPVLRELQIDIELASDMLRIHKGGTWQMLNKRKGFL